VEVSRKIAAREHRKRSGGPLLRKSSCRLRNVIANGLREEEPTSAKRKRSRSKPSTEQNRARKKKFQPRLNNDLTKRGDKRAGTRTGKRKFLHNYVRKKPSKSGEQRVNTNSSYHAASLPMKCATKERQHRYQPARGGRQR